MLALNLVVVLALLFKVFSLDTKSYKVTGLDKYGATDDMYSGFMPIDMKNNEEGSFFFWLAKQRSPVVAHQKKKLVVWLNGGPGCSSMVGMMHEHGPFTIEDPVPTPPLAPGQLPPGKIPGETPGRNPGDTPGYRPGSTPYVPGNIPGEIPGINPGDTPYIPGDTPYLPGDTPGYTPGEVGTIGDSGADTRNPGDLAPGELPGETPGYVPGESDKESDSPAPGILPPGEVPGEVPGDVPGEVPGAVEEEPSASSSNAAVDNSNADGAAAGDVDVPGEVPGFVPGENPGEIPGEVAGWIPGLDGVEPEAITWTRKQRAMQDAAAGYTLKRNPYSWNELANVLYVEQPIRVGFSTAAKGAAPVQSEAVVAADFHGFLTSFLTVFTEYQDADIFITGESFAGAYIPWIAKHIVEKQAESSNADYYRKIYDKTYVPPSPLPFLINIRGVAIGNGAIDDQIQEGSLAEYAYSHGLIPRKIREKIDDKYQRCLLNNGGIFHPKRLTRGDINKCGVSDHVIAAAGNPNIYNTNTFLSYDDLLKPDGIFHRFFNDPEIQETLHVRGYNLPGLNFRPEGANCPRCSSASNQQNHYYAPAHWEVCNDKMNDDFDTDRPISAVPALQYLAEQKVSVLLYNGEFDLIGNHLGTQHTLEQNEWLGEKWSSAARSLWVVEGDVAGEYFSISNLAFLVVRKSGHLVPMDLPKEGMELIRRFIHGLSFADRPLASDADFIHNMDVLEPSPALQATGPTGSGSLFTLTFIFVSFGAVVALIYRHHKAGQHEYTWDRAVPTSMTGFSSAVSQQGFEMPVTKSVFGYQSHSQYQPIPEDC